MAARKRAAAAEVIRRRAAPGAAVQGTAQMPEGWEEFTGRELGSALGVSAGDAEEILDLAWHLEVNLPGTRAAFRAGVLNRDKAQIIANVTALPDTEEDPRAEANRQQLGGELAVCQVRAG